MAGITQLLQGDVVPVYLQIADGATDQYPQAVVYDNAGTVLTTISLVHVSAGLYQPATPYLMPNKESVQVVYTIYTDAGHTVESVVYLRDMDVFCIITPTAYMATGFATQNPPSQDLADYKADVSSLALEVTVQAIKTKTDLINWDDITFLKDIEGGKWKIENNQMIFYKADNTTEVARFNLFDIAGMPASFDIFERQRV